MRFVQRGRGGSESSSAVADPLTGLGDHQAFVRALGDTRQAVLARVDIDGLRRVNLLHGVAEGDRVLGRVARTSELFGPSFRIGADEFAVLLPELHDIGRFERALSTDPGVRVSVSIGFVAVREAPEAPDELLLVLERAELALKEAKRRGRGHVVDAATLGADRLVVSAPKVRALYELFGQQRLRAAYQPIIATADQDVIGFEAFARPQLDYGFSGPEEALEIAEALGDAAELDDLCRQSIFGDGPGFAMRPNELLFINVHPAALGHQSLRAEGILAQARHAGLPPERIVFEFSDRVPIASAAFTEQADELAEAGFSLSLDDVGGGNAGLRRLHSGRFRFVKMEAKLLQAAAGDARATGMVDAICTFCDRTNARVIVSGVEDAESLALARALRRLDGTMRVHGVQGFQLGKPTQEPRMRGREPG